MSRSCEERLQLEKEFWVAMHHHLLREEAAKAAPMAESARANQEEERAKEARELARRLLEQHQTEHGC